ncbi:MAG TPA: hypothetical protein VHS53_06055, partial [Mucilaginibacter sp.]|nr:hypothetical protein [Mucilaginibacter sp.]
QWIGTSTPTPTGWSTNTWKAGISASILPTSIITPTAATVPLAPATTTSTTTTASSGSVINYTGKSNISIANLVINGGSVPCITLTNCSNVYINACTLQNSTDAAIVLNNCVNVVIQSNKIGNVAAGIVAKNCPSGGIKVFTNLMKNMQGQKYNGAFVQYVSVGGANNSISGNKMQNFSGSSNPLYAIDIQSSIGTSSSPITITDNQIEGGGPSTSGGGILLGHNGGAYQVANSNTLVNPGEFGMAIIGGNTISITNNSIFAAKETWTNVGIFIQGQGGYNVSATTVSGNKVNWTNSSGAQANEWLASGEATPSGWSTNSWGASGISAALLPTTLVSL